MRYGRHYGGRIFIAFMRRSMVLLDHYFYAAAEQLTLAITAG